MQNGMLNKWKLLNDEEQPTGLVIVHTQPSCPLPAQVTKVPSASQLLPARPPATAKQFKASHKPGPLCKGKERDMPMGVRLEQDVDEDLQQMETETDDLRRQSQSQS
ncbi:hypothetical protein EWM64_g9006 [Hericium alpestre]|uniref:Uncharacterized protein n=1 Tax=Hericium alpestre TaxID=135208 RepID=A0A4Y9ZNK5_9AGAM|nr:hypothetical protein EWM64_g9006 [Hericium alpestre]